MSIFALGNIEGILPDSQQIFKQLVIDGKGQYDEFENEINEHTTFGPELKTFLHRLDYWAENINRKPPPNIQIITRETGQPTEYEYKSANLRIYIVKISDNRIIISGETKKPTKQSRQIKQFRNLINQYLISLK